MPTITACHQVHSCQAHNNPDGRRGAPIPVSDRVRLSYDARKISRQKVLCESGTELGLFLPRGTVLVQGDVLESEAGIGIEVCAAQEALSTVCSDDQHVLLRAAYHLGNRHVAVQIDVGRLAYQQDHVLDAMIQGLGLEVHSELAAFHPEPGAYAHRSGSDILAEGSEKNKPDYHSAHSHDHHG